MSLKVIYKEQDIKSYKKKKTIYLFVYYFEDLSQMFHQCFGCLPINWAGWYVCVGGGRQQSPFSFKLGLFQPPFINSTNAYWVGDMNKQASRHYNIYTKILIYKAWSLDFTSADGIPMWT